jgi:FkbM family methyltransferase
MDVYVQIGSNVGNDHFQKIIENTKDKSKIILIEPNIDLLKELSENYKELNDKHEIIISNFGISLTNEFLEFYLYTDISGHSSIIRRKSHPPDIFKKIKTISFNEFCEKLLIKDIECLYIDTEGLDYEILNSIDFSKINIQTIYFEKWGFDNDDLNEKYRTGPEFLKSVLLKFENYIYETEFIDGMETYKLTKKT